METIDFSNNWNNKLDNIYFTTIRLYNQKKYTTKNNFNITLQHQFIKKAVIVDIRIIYLSEINDFIAGLDTGYTVAECKNIFKRMYPKIDFTTQKLQFILLTTIK